MHYPVVYALYLVNAVMGLLMAYCGSGQRCSVRRKESVRERTTKFGLDADAHWEIQVMWQLAFLHPVSKSWQWSKQQLRFVYEFAETIVINRNRNCWNMNILNYGFHLGRCRNIFLEGLFSGGFDPGTYSRSA